MCGMQKRGHAATMVEGSLRIWFLNEKTNSPVSIRCNKKVKDKVFAPFGTSRCFWVWHISQKSSNLASANKDRKTGKHDDIQRNRSEQRSSTRQQVTWIKDQKTMTFTRNCLNLLSAQTLSNRRCKAKRAGGHSSNGLEQKQKHWQSAEGAWKAYRAEGHWLKERVFQISLWFSCFPSSKQR